MNVLFIGDIVGENGLLYIKENIAAIKREHKINLTIVNGENTTLGRGLSFSDYKSLMKMGVDVITLGNHFFGQEEIKDYIDNSNVIRPMNIETKIGNGFINLNYNNQKITIINLIGQININCHEHNINNPFLTMDDFLKENPSDFIIVDFHAEATSEKIAFARAYDGICKAIIGTHTHVQTADEQILPKGTFYITDAGMTGPKEGVIGIRPEIIIDRFKNNSAQPFRLCEGKSQLNGVILNFNTNKIKRIHLSE